MKQKSLLGRTSPNQKKLIAEFCSDLLKSLKRGKKGWHGNLGLCSNFATWTSQKEMVGRNIDSFLLSYKFKKAYPFNGSSSDYRRDYLNKTMFENEERMAFVREWARKHVAVK